MTDGKLFYSSGSSASCSVTTSRGGMGQWGGSEAHGGGDICVLRADPHCYMVETHRT